MKASLKSQSTRVALVCAGVVVLAIAFWLLLLGPKRDEASRLSQRVDALSAELAAEEQRVATGLEAKREFPADYRELIVLGKAVPGDAETASLLVQINQLGARSDTRFQSIVLAGGGDSGEAAAAESAPATEGGAALAPIGSSVGPAGLLAMPYELEFSGGFFEVTNFIREVDSQVQTTAGTVQADGRLMTIDGFVLEPLEGTLSSVLEASFRVTTFITPPGQGLTAGASPAGPAETETSS